ncbi:ATP synthase F0 subunit B [Candidatus Uhrbacteria bacterium CG_4_9_14_3_um_filter_36_7]|uniref:ATP synthase subunit b n=1 Tax=Candidatus Uhrbacteria bacterium CG_4_9_14_3_um_filter_36_7 TaxID=1975033 RepID=A0A2M7XIM5_9BACT|nr:MAG: ATP synthase F0 subunit B [Candidatus Uhrbacteria bacterium CG_4_9_14_3_um_filter_36_7]
MDQQIVQQTTEAIHQTGGISALGLNAKLFAAQLIHFLIVAMIFWKWIYRPLVLMIEKRSEKIDKGLAHTKEMEERLSSLETEREEIIKNAKQEALNLVKNAHEQTEERNEKMIQKTKQDVEKIVLDGKKRLIEEKEIMIQETRKEMALLAVQAAKKILEDSIDEKLAKKKAEEVIEKHLSV